MKTSKAVLSQTIPAHDYRPALQGALSWLGNRYLLAEPVNRRSEEARAQYRELPPAQPKAFVVRTLS